MTPEELLLDRYRVIADYFYNPYKIGDIITVRYADRSVLLTNTSHRDEFGETVNVDHYFHPNRLKDFPHLFQPLPWYAEREISDFPEYVRYSEYYLNHYHLDEAFKEKVFKVDKWQKGHYGIRATGRGIIHGYEINFIPATLAEYEQWKQSKNK
jgi:hypothetical protein